MMDGPRWRRGGWLACLLALALALAGPAAAQDSAAQAKIAHITYLAGQTAYVDAGRLDGLREAARVDVVRGGKTLGVLKVAYLASHRASCDVVSAAAALAVGDSVRFVPAPAPRDSTVAAGTSSTSSSPRGGGSSHRLRGRAGVAYFVMRQHAGAGGRVSEPALDLRLDGPLGASAVNLAMDVRARRTYTILSDGSAVTDGRNRVYQAAVSVNAPGSPARHGRPPDLGKPGLGRPVRRPLGRDEPAGLEHGHVHGQPTGAARPRLLELGSRAGRLRAAPQPAGRGLAVDGDVRGGRFLSGCAREPRIRLRAGLLFQPAFLDVRHARGRLLSAVEAPARNEADLADE